jgi:hypothetical protein
MEGKFVDLQDTIDGFRDVVAGKYDHLPEQAFYMVGGIEEVVASAEKIAADVARMKAIEAEKKGEKVEGSAAAAGGKKEVTAAEVMQNLKRAADEAKKAQLDRAAEISEVAKTVPEGELYPGWAYPTAEQLNQQWSEWDSLYATQSADFDAYSNKFVEEIKAQPDEMEL